MQQPCNKESSYVSAQCRTELNTEHTKMNLKVVVKRVPVRYYKRGLMGGTRILGLSEGNARCGKMMINIGI